MDVSSNNRRKWRWWRLQFGLRSLLAVMLAACLLMGAWRWVRYSYERQQAALEELRPLAKFVRTSPGRPAWLRPLQGDELFQDVTHLSFDGNRSVDDSHLAALERFPQLIELSLGRTSVTDEGLAHLSKLSHLEILSLNSTRLTDTGLAHLRGLKRLKHLDLSDSRVTGDGLGHLAELPKLEFLALNGLKVADDHLPHLLTLAELTTLSLNPSEIQGPGLQTLQVLPKLSTLRVDSATLKRVDIAGFQQLKVLGLGGELHPQRAEVTVRDCPLIEQLLLMANSDRIELRDLPRLKEYFEIQSVSFSRQMLQEHESPSHNSASNFRSFSNLPSLPALSFVTPGQLALDLKGMSGLKEIIVSSPNLPIIKSAEVPALTELRLAQLRLDRRGSFSWSGLENLRRLHLETFRFDGGWRLDTLGDLPLLEELTLYCGRLDHDEFASLGRLKKLSLDQCRLAKESLQSMSELQSLEELEISSMELGASEFAQISKLPGLRTLRLDQVKASREGLSHLSQLLSLKSLELTGGNTSEAEVQELSKALPPGCRATFSSYLNVRTTLYYESKTFVRGEPVETDEK